MLPGELDCDDAVLHESLLVDDVLRAVGHRRQVRRRPHVLQHQAVLVLHVADDRVGLALS